MRGGRRAVPADRRAVAIGLALLGLALVALVARSTSSHPISTPPVRTHTVAPSIPPTQGDLTRPGRRHTKDSDTGSTVTLLITVALFFIAVVVLLRNARRPHWRGFRHVVGVPEEEPVERPDPETDDGRLRGAVQAGMDALHTTDSDRLAIIACWRQVVSALAARGAASAASDTSTQIVVRALESRGVRTEPMHELARLYREASFSRHALGPADRQAAQACLEQISADLEAVPR